ncbi:MAG: SDR family oxidoreductase [Proteobacteria bacterium]|nr:SDR family oxidoreductase [Pseudomonadota bacterium]
MTDLFMNRTALITGASSGIGAEFARQLHARGSSVILVARRADRLGALAQELNSLRRDSASVMVADLCKAAALDQVAERLQRESVDILVNNAGHGSFGMLENLPLANELAMVDLNIRAPLILTHAAIPGWKARGGGVLFGVASIAALQPLPYMATYSATKAFDFNHTVALWAELKRFGIRVTAVCPGPTDTEFAGVARVPGHFTGAPRDPVAVVVRRSIQASELGFPYVVPGMRGWLLALGPRLLPTWLTTSMTERMLRGILPSAAQ